MFDSFEEELIKRIKALSQGEGLKDDEIAKLVGCHRATINRKRLQYKIPTANLANRKDKDCKCEECGLEYVIRRKERRKKRCVTCREKK